MDFGISHHRRLIVAHTVRSRTSVQRQRIRQPLECQPPENVLTENDAGGRSRSADAATQKGEHIGGLEVRWVGVVTAADDDVGLGRD
jgi:hypothetical protein